MEYIPYVVMPTFKEGHIPTKYLIKDQAAPEHFGVLSTKVQDQGSTHAPGMGTLDHVQGP